MRIDVYSDTTCPWCFLAKRRFEVALAARPWYEPKVAFRPLELNPELPTDGVDRAVHWAAKIGGPERIRELLAELSRQGEATGIRFRFDLIERVPNTRRSHLLIAHAARSGRQAAVLDRVMRAYFEEGCDIGELEELVRLGVEVGLAENQVRSALVLRVGQDGVVAAERHASVLRITGVPTFVFDGQYTMSGAQDAATYTRIFDQVAELAARREAVS